MKTATILIVSLLATQLPLQPITALPSQPTNHIAQADLTDGTLTPQEVQKTAKHISVRISSENNGGSGVIIAQKGNNYLILTNAHVIKRSTKIEIKAPDGKKYPAKTIDGGFDSKYDLALLQFTSTTKYTLANLSSISGSPLTPERTIYSAGFPFDSKEIRITRGEVSQLSDIPFDDGTQLGYITNKGEKGIRQGMSGGAIFDAQGNLLGINTISIAPILPDYTYNDGSKPLPKLRAKYQQANWGIPVYNFLTRVKPDILYGYANLPKVERQVTPTGYMAKLNIRARQMTVRIENSGGNGSGVIVAREGNSYYVLTAKHVLQNPETQQKYTNHQIITYDQDRHSDNGIVVAEGVDMAVVKFTSNVNYPVAQLGEYSPNNDDLAFVGGFPGRTKINSPLWQWQLNPGFIYSQDQGKFQTQDNLSFSNGYDLVYSSITHGGMSGGPVFDTGGNVIGIHGKGEETNVNSLGISIQTFTGLATKLKVDPILLSIVKNNPIELNQKYRKDVIATIENIPEPQVGDEGNRWLDYGNQLVRSRQQDKSLAAFDRAISKNKVLMGSYGKAFSLRNTGKYQLAETAIDQSIAVIPINNRANYYYFWKEKSLILKGLKKYDAAIKSIDLAILLQGKSTNANNRKDPILLNEKAGIFLESKNYLAMIPIYDDIIQNQPQVYAIVNRGVAKLQLDKNQDAISDFNLAITIDPNYTIAYIGRGLTKVNLNKTKEAITDYNRAIALNSKFAYAYYVRGNAYYKLNMKKEAITDLDRAIALDSKYADAYRNRGIYQASLDNNQKAMDDYNQAIELNPKDHLSYTSRGLMQFKLGKDRAAIVDLDRAIALSPKSYLAYSTRGSAYSNLNMNKEAIADYDQVIALSPKDVSIYHERGMSKYKIGQKEAAIIDYDRAITLNPEDANVYHNRAIAKSDIGYKKDAIADLDRAITLNPKYTIAYNTRGITKYNIGQKEKAITDYDRAIALDPKYTDAYNNRGNAKLFLGKQEEAIADFDRAITLSPKFAVIYVNRSSARFLFGDNMKGIMDTDRAIAIDPNLADAYNNRGLFKIIIGKERDALIDLDQAIKLDPKQSESYACRGFVKEMFGDKQGAISDYKQAIQINPQLLADWRKQAELVITYNAASYQKYQQMIQKLDASTRLTRS